MRCNLTETTIVGKGRPMKTKLALPRGTQVGSVLLVTWSGAEGSIEPGSYDGRVLGIKDPRVTLRFEYPGEDQPEIVVVNLETGMDETYHARVSAIQLAQRARRARQPV